MDNFASLDTPGSSGGVKVVEWNQNQLIRSLCIAINETKIAFIGTYLKEKILNTGYDNDSNPESSYMKCFFTYGSDGQEKKRLFVHYTMLS